jgi:hypothetical protein
MCPSPRCYRDSIVGITASVIRYRGAARVAAMVRWAKRQ